MHNDISFVIDSRVFLYEHQSTYSPNLPLRYLMYMADLYSKITKDKNLYGRKKVEIPAPRFLIFYNGEEERPEREVMQLSDAYQVVDIDPALELHAELINIGPGKNVNLLKACKTLGDYSEYTFRVRKYAKKMPIEEAVDQAVEECIREGILAEFLTKWKAEAIKVSIYEYDEERQRQFDRAEGKEEGEMIGRIAGKTEDLLSFLEELGEVSEELKRKITSQTDIVLLNTWIKLAAKANSIEEFVSALDETKG